MDRIRREKYLEKDMERAMHKWLEQGSVLGKIKDEIKEWYWQVDKQALAKDPCVVDAMVDLFIRTVDKYKSEIPTGSTTKEEPLKAGEEIERIQKSVPYEEIEKAYESIMDVEENGYVDIEEIKVHFCKWLGIEDK